MSFMSLFSMKTIAEISIQLSNFWGSFISFGLVFRLEERWQIKGIPWRPVCVPVPQENYARCGSFQRVWVSVLCSLVLTSSNHASVLFICCTLVDRSPILRDLICFSFLKELSFHLLVTKKRKGKHSEKRKFHLWSVLEPRMYF